MKTKMIIFSAIITFGLQAALFKQQDQRKTGPPTPEEVIKLCNLIHSNTIMAIDAAINNAPKDPLPTLDRLIKEIQRTYDIISNSSLSNNLIEIQQNITNLNDHANSLTNEFNKTILRDFMHQITNVDPVDKALNTLRSTTHRLLYLISTLNEFESVIKKLSASVSQDVISRITIQRLIHLRRNECIFTTGEQPSDKPSTPTTSSK